MRRASVRLPGKRLKSSKSHIAVDQFLAALEAVYPGKADEVEVFDFFGRDEALAYLCFVCAEMLSVRTPGKSKHVTALTQLFDETYSFGPRVGDGP
jgi:hypothetical protein